MRKVEAPTWQSIHTELAAGPRELVWCIGRPFSEMAGSVGDFSEIAGIGTSGGDLVCRALLERSIAAGLPPASVSSWLSRNCRRSKDRSELLVLGSLRSLPTV